MAYAYAFGWNMHPEIPTPISDERQAMAGSLAASPHTDKGTRASRRREKLMVPHTAG
jgi:hypothetical protein